MRIKCLALLISTLWVPTALSDTTGLNDKGYNSKNEEIKTIQRERRDAKMSMYEAIKPADENVTVSVDTRKQCLELWGQRLPYGYKAVGESYEVRPDLKTGKLTINGKLDVITGDVIPYKFICALTDQLIIDRFRTYFSIRFDQQARRMGHKGGAFGNPYLRRITDEEVKKYGSRKAG